MLYAAPAAVLLGFAVGQGIWSDQLTHSSWYLPMAALLLATGLYGSTHEIDLASVRRDLRTAVVAVTLGVLFKAAFIAGMMLLFFRKPEYLVLGIIVAQIDPLSVAAMRGNSGMSERAKTLLSVWAAFDDPVTVLLSVYLSAVGFRLAGRSGTPAPAPGGSSTAYVVGIVLNVLLCSAAIAAWYISRLVWAGYVKRRSARPEQRRGGVAVRKPPDPSRASDVIALVVVVVLLLVAAASMLMLAVALAGLLIRTGRFRERINKLVTLAFLLAAFGLGVLLVGGASPGAGIALGALAFGAQAVVALVMVPSMLPDLPRTDKVYLALGQQNGITAIILALALEPEFPGTVGIVGPAVLTISVLYYTSNGLWARHLRAREAADGSDQRVRGDGRRGAVRVPADPVGRPDLAA